MSNETTITPESEMASLAELLVSLAVDLQAIRTNFILEEAV